MTPNFDDLWNAYSHAQFGGVERPGAREVREIGEHLVTREPLRDGLYYVDRTPWDRRTVAVIRWRGKFYELEMPESTPSPKLRSMEGVMDLAVSMRPLLRVELSDRALR